MAISETGRHGDNVVTHVVRVLGPEKGNATIRLRKTEDGTAILDGVLKLSGVMSPTAQVYHSSKILEKYLTIYITNNNVFILYFLLLFSSRYLE